MSWHDGGKKKEKRYATKRRVSNKTSAELYKFLDTVYRASDKKKIGPAADGETERLRSDVRAREG
ncbi:unnamed protein product [Fusarium graminearum]|uniref:Uncharacterized protein n=1 Tax=Gibberella zeae TaxID=5518 RepID=A0A4E9DRR2_GIBZA|nr:unnamed protein product [Fusarium graminearum]CAF3477098.1 unnamed protein product [Fusarium graminearum]CAG1975511.1 unnamed protein product [Fusarium graminearum]